MGVTTAIKRTLQPETKNRKLGARCLPCALKHYHCRVYRAEAWGGHRLSIGDVMIFKRARAARRIRRALQYPSIDRYNAIRALKSADMALYLRVRHVYWSDTYGADKRRVKARRGMAYHRRRHLASRRCDTLLGRRL